MGKHILFAGVFLCFVSLVSSGCVSDSIGLRELPTTTSNVQEIGTAEPTQLESTVEPAVIQELESDLQLSGFAYQRSCQKADPCLVDGEELLFGSQLSLVSLEGSVSDQIYIPALGDVVHVASRVDFTDPDEVVIVFRNFENNAFEFIKNGEIVRSLVGTNISNIKGADAQEGLALSYLPGVTGIGGTDSGRSEISIYPGMGPMVISKELPMVLVPIAVRANGEMPPNNEMVDFWYTYEPYGIGGNLVYPPYNGLYYHPPGNDVEVHELLPDSIQFSGLSPDGSMAAYTIETKGDLFIRDLRVYSEKKFPLLSSSDQGAGFAVFSPDSQKVAWMEASGSLADNTFMSVVRVGTTSGEAVTSVTSAEFGENITMLKPVAWLDGETILVQAVVPRTDGFLLILNIEGTAEQVTASGRFVGLIYD